MSLALRMPIFNNFQKNDDSGGTHKQKFPLLLHDENWEACLTSLWMFDLFNEVGVHIYPYLQLFILGSCHVSHEYIRISRNRCDRNHDQNINMIYWFSLVNSQSMRRDECSYSLVVLYEEVKRSTIYYRVPQNSYSYIEKLQIF